MADFTNTDQVWGVNAAGDTQFWQDWSDHLTQLTLTFVANDNLQSQIEGLDSLDLSGVNVTLDSDVSLDVAYGTTALGTSEIADGACATVVTVSAPGVLTTDVVDIGYDATPIGKTGYDPTAGEELSIRAFPTADNINILVCNRTGAAVTPSAMNINWKVTR